MSREVQRREFSASHQAHPPVAGSSVFLISTSWFSGWSNFVGLRGKPVLEATAPGPINNTPLLTPLGLRKGLQTSKDFVFVTRPTWELLVSWYGGGPSVERNAAVNPATGEVEPVMRSQNVRVRFGDAVMTAKVNEFTRIGDLRQLACKHFHVDPRGLGLVDTVGGKMVRALADPELVENCNVVECWPLLLCDEEPTAETIRPGIEWQRAPQAVEVPNMKGIEGPGHVSAVMQCIARMGSISVGESVCEFLREYRESDEKVVSAKKLSTAIDVSDAESQGDAHEFFVELVEREMMSDPFEGSMQKKIECLRCGHVESVDERFTALSVDMPRPMRMSRKIKFVGWNLDEPMYVFRVPLPVDYTKEIVELILSASVHRKVKIEFAERRENGLEWVESPGLIEGTGSVYAFEVLKKQGCYAMVEVKSGLLNKWSTEYLTKVSHPYLIEVSNKEPLLSVCRERFGVLFRTPEEMDENFDLNKLSEHSRVFEGSELMTVSGRPDSSCFLAKEVVELILNPSIVRDKNRFDWKALRSKELRIRKEHPDVRRLDTCLKLMCEPEMVDAMNVWQCPKCDWFGPALHTLQLQKLPRTLVIHVKRYANDLTKIRSEIEYPDELDMGVYVKSAEKTRYRLFGVVEHIGGLSGGCYLAHVLSDDGKWVLCDHERLVSSTRSKAHSASAYMLFYEVIE